MSSQLQVLYEGKIDFFGQEAVDKWTRIALSIATSLSFLVGFIMQSLKTTFLIFGGSVLVILILAVPPWPYLNQYPVAWTDAKIEDKKKR